MQVLLNFRALFLKQDDIILRGKTNYNNYIYTCFQNHFKFENIYQIHINLLFSHQKEPFWENERYIYIYTYIFDIYCQCCNVFANGCIYIRGSVLTLVKANAVERLGNTLYPSLLGKGIWPWSWITTLAPAVSLSSAMYCDCSINRLSFNPGVYKCIQEWFTPRIHYSFSLI